MNVIRDSFALLLVLLPLSAAPAARPDSATIHWRPAAPGVFGDPNPFFWKGEYHVFYLLPGEHSLAWEHIVSKDLVYWRELPRALDPGRKGEPDESNAASGSIVEKDGTFHIFYVGFNSGHATLIVGFRQQPKPPASGYRLTIRPQTQEIEIAGPRYMYRRRCPMDRAKPIQVQVFLDGSILECFVNDAYAFTMRSYDFREGKLSLEVSNGLVRVLELKLKTRQLIPDPAPAQLPSGGQK